MSLSHLASCLPFPSSPSDSDDDDDGFRSGSRHYSLSCHLLAAALNAGHADRCR